MATMMTIRRSALLALFLTSALHRADGKVVPMTASQRAAAAKAAAAAARPVELPRNKLPASEQEGSGSSTNLIIDQAVSPSFVGADIRDDILPPSPSTPHSPKLPQSPRNLLLDGITPPTNNYSHGQHESLSTSYSGSIPSSSLEFTVENRRSDGKHAVISGLGLNVRIVSDAAGSRGAAAAGSAGSGAAEPELEPEPTPCRIKLYTKRGEGMDVEGESDPIDSDAVKGYELAVDAKVMCQGEGEETLLSSDLFLKNWREMEAATGDATSPGGRQLRKVGERRKLSKWEELLETLGMGERDTARRENKIQLVGSRKKNAKRRNLEGDDVAYEDMIYKATEDVVENMDHGIVHNTVHDYTVTDTTAASTGDLGLSEVETAYPLLIPPNGTLSVYIVVLPLEGLTAEGKTVEGTNFLLLADEGDATDAEGDATDEGGETAKSLYKATTTLNLYTGSSVVLGTPSTGGTVDETKFLAVTSPTVFNGAIYYDTFDGALMGLGEYYNKLEYSLLPGDSLHGIPGCDKSMSTGYFDTVGSYGVMFDVTSDIEPDDSDHDDFELSRFKNVEIFGMDLYIRNLVNTSFEVYVRKNSFEVAKSTRQKYTSYSAPAGQTLIATNWDRVAKGTVEGRGPDVGSPIPSEMWRKKVLLRPGETVGFYVTVAGAPDLRYRNTTIPEGNIYKSNGVLNIGVGRSWGEYPLRGDGTDVYFSPREFSGSFHYHVHEGLCESTSPSVSPSFSPYTYSPSQSSAPTKEIEHSFGEHAKDEGLCPEDNTLETTYQDGTGSYGALFDMLAKTNIMLTGIDLNIDWNTDATAHVLVYAREGSWFGHQNNAASWTHLLVNTTLSRPHDFHNRSKDGAYIPISVKKNSAIVPRKAFTPLEMTIGDTWSLYVCTSIPDFRYTLGTSIGKTFAANPELRVMEGAGAADYPPFHGGKPETGGVEYTFYAPRVWNGNLRYDYVTECPSEAPSSLFTTPPPSVTPSLTTTVSYAFYVEHSPKKLNGAVMYDMSFGVRAVLDKFTDGGEDILFKLDQQDGLVIEKVVPNVVSPSAIGYLCYPTPPDICTPISVEVTATHRNTATSDEVMFALLRQSEHLPSLINVDGYAIQYVGDRAVETNSEITLSGIPDREMQGNEQEFFESVARDFLRNQVKVPGLDNDSLRILSVTVNNQVITSGGSYAIDDPTSSASARNNNQRRLEKGSNNVQVSVRGKYRPPPEVDFGELVEESINRDRELLKKELNSREAEANDEKGDELTEGTASGYFENADVVGARQMKEESDATSEGNPAIMAGTIGGLEEKDDDKMKGMLNLAAMACGGLIGLLSLVFILRPHRRRAMFSSGTDHGAHRRTQPVDVEDDIALLKKSRALVRGYESEGLTDSGNSFPGARGSNMGSDQAYNPTSSAGSEQLRFSNFSTEPAVYNPNDSGTSGAHSERLSFTRGPGHPLRSSGSSSRNPYTRGGGPPGGPPPPGGFGPGDPRSSFTRGGPGDPRSSFTRGGPGDPRSSFTRGGPGNPSSSFTRGGPGELSSSFTRGGGPPRGHHNSMPPVQRGPSPHMGNGGHMRMNHSMPPQRGGPQRVSQDGVPPGRIRRSSQDRGGGMPMPPRHTSGEGGHQQMQDPRLRNHHGYR